MKHILKAAIVILCFCIVWACSDSDNPYENGQSITIQSMDIFFTPAASSGKIIVSSPNEVMAKSSAPWCKVQNINGGSITLEADANTSLEGRTAVISIYSANDSVSVTAQQEGLVFTIIASNIITDDDAGSRTFDLQHNFDGGVNLYSSADWLRWAIEGNHFIINYDANNSGHKRSAYVYYTVAGFKDSILVQQVDFNKDFAGKYKIRSSNSAVDGMIFSLYEDRLVFDDYNQTIEGKFDTDKGTFTTSYGQKTGTPEKFISLEPHLPSSYSQYNINLEALTERSNSGWHYPNMEDHTFGPNTGTLVITFSYDEVTGKHIGTLSGKYNGWDINGLQFGVFEEVNTPFLYHGKALQFPNAHFEK